MAYYWKILAIWGLMTYEGLRVGETPPEPQVPLDGEAITYGCGILEIRES